MKIRENKKKIFTAVSVFFLMLCFTWMYYSAEKAADTPPQEVVPAVQWIREAKKSTSTEEIGEYDLYAKAAVLIDGDSGRILYSKNAEEIMPMASTTKIMTCIVALEVGNLSDSVSTSAYAASQPRVKLGIPKNSVHTLKDLLYSLMLESHNDAAVAIAEHIGAGLVEVPETGERTAEESALAVLAFAELMNQKAAEIGCEDTFFITPNGLDANQTVQGKDGTQETRSHSTTAADLAAIMRYCAFLSPKRQEFLEITQTASYSFADASGKRNYNCNNHNSFLNMMDGALTGKTGFTNAAGYCYVGALERDGKTFAVALLACGWPNHKSWKWADTKKLMNYGINNYELQTFEEVLFKEEDLPVIPVENGQTKGIGGTAYVNLKIQRGSTKTEDGKEGILLRKDEKIQILKEMKESLQAPVHAGDQVGNIQYAINGVVYKTDLILAARDVLRIDFRWCFGRIWNMFSL